MVVARERREARGEGRSGCSEFGLRQTSVPGRRSRRNCGSIFGPGMPCGKELQNTTALAPDFRPLTGDPPLHQRPTRYTSAADPRGFPSNALAASTAAAAPHSTTAANTAPGHASVRSAALASSWGTSAGSPSLTTTRAPRWAATAPARPEP